MASATASSKTATPRSKTPAPAAKAKAAHPSTPGKAAGANARAATGSASGGKARASRASSPSPAKAASPVAPSPHGGMGAVVVHGDDAGVTFRVWAPNASAVRVTGGFCDWRDGDDAPALARENDAGYWSVHVPAAKNGDEYKYVLDTPAGTLHRNDPYARVVTSSVGNSVVYDTQAFDWGGDVPLLAPGGGLSWDRLVVYELHVGTFFDRNGDGLGTFDELAQRLLWLREAVGVNAIEIMPVAEFAGDRSWGYNPAHPFAVEGAYGGPDGLKRLVKAAHAVGLAVIVDVVYNHFGPSDLDLWRFDGWSENDKGGIYFYNDHRSETPWGDTRPDYGRPEVRQYLLDNARMWLDEYHADGLRLDMVLYVRNRTATPCEFDALPEGWALMQEINALVARDFPGRITIAEDLQTEPGMTAPVEVGGAGFGSQWDAAFVHPVRAVLEAPTDAERSMPALAAALAHRYGTDALRRVVYTESHDEVANGKQRVVSHVEALVGAGRSGEDARRISRGLAGLGTVLVATAPGIPMVFQGQETLMEGWFEDVKAHTVAPERAETVAVPHEAIPDQVLAAEMPHSTDADTLVPLAGEAIGEAGHVEGIAFGPSLVGDLFRLRASDDAAAGLRGHEVTFLRVDDAAKVIAYVRHDGDAGTGTVVVLNVSETPHDAYTLPMPGEGTWRLRLNSALPIYHPAFPSHETGDVHADPAEVDGFPACARLSLAPYGALVFTR